MPRVSMRIIVSGKLIRLAEGEHPVRRRAGRPIGHSTCLILAMLGAKLVLGVGYREACRLFSGRGFVKTPDFRTLQWRAARLAKPCPMSIGFHRVRGNYSVLLEPALERPPGKREMGRSEWEGALRRLGRDFMEIAV